MCFYLSKIEPAYRKEPVLTSTAKLIFIAKKQLYVFTISH